MDINSTDRVVTNEAKTSRLPAGSMLRLPNGICVPHPNAEINLAGCGDPRMGEKAVIESVKLETSEIEKPAETHTLTTATLVQRPFNEAKG